MDGIVKIKPTNLGRPASGTARPQKISEEGETKKTEEPKMELKTSLPLIKWEAPEYDYIPKSNNWFWSVIIITIGLVFASFLLGNMLFAILVMISGLTIILYGARMPRKISFSFTSRGLIIEKRLYLYENLRSFWIQYEPPHKKLLAIVPKKHLMPAISIPLGNVNPNDIREHLLKFLKEERYEETFVQTISHLIGF
jgi:hypothetical protein